MLKYFLLRLLLVGACCITGSFAHTRFLVLSDIHYGSHNNSQPGHDTGDTLLQLSMNKAKALSHDADFILYLGDLPTHLWGYIPEKARYEKTLFHALFKADVAKKPMFYVSGNNDSLTGNYQPFESNGKSPLLFATDWSGACVYCDGLIIDGSHMRSKAYYSAYAMPGNKDLLLIVLNATQWMRSHVLLPKYPNQEQDAKAQLAWLQEQLSSHKAKQVLIALHEPPGNDYKGNLMWQKQYMEEFIAILAANQKNYGHITLLTSHTHRDEIRKIPLPYGNAIYAYSTPSVSRIYYNNPAMKLFALDAELDLVDFTTYYTTTLDSWGQDKYQALSGKAAIFPVCHNKTLTQCLGKLTDEDVCNYIEQGHFYGVKSLKVDNKACRLTYLVK